MTGTFQIGPNEAKIWQIRYLAKLPTRLRLNQDLVDKIRINLMFRNNNYF